jgi:hypothetical protein
MTDLRRARQVVTDDMLYKVQPPCPPAPLVNGVPNTTNWTPKEGCFGFGGPGTQGSALLMLPSDGENSPEPRYDLSLHRWAAICAVSMHCARHAEASMQCAWTGLTRSSCKQAQLAAFLTGCTCPADASAAWIRSWSHFLLIGRTQGASTSMTCCYLYALKSLGRVSMQDLMHL